MNLLFWSKRKKDERAKHDAEQEAKIREIHKQIFRSADEVERITKIAKELIEGKEWDIAHQIFLATRKGKKK